MAITVGQAFEIRTVQGVSAETSSAGLSYIVRGTNDIDAARGAVVTAAPATYTVGPYVLNLLEVSSDAEGDELFRSQAQYGIARTSGSGTVGGTPPNEFSFDIGGGTDHITQAIATTPYAPSGVTAPDYQKAIGVTDTGVEGADIVAPQFNFSIVKYFANSALNTAYYVAVRGLVGKTNAGSFQGFAAGEVLFLGATGTRRSTSSSDRTPVTFKFAVNAPVTGATIGTITGINKAPWELVDVRYTELEDTTAKTVVKRPTAVYVHQVYESGNFGDLNL